MVPFPCDRTWINQYGLQLLPPHLVVGLRGQWQDSVHLVAHYHNSALSVPILQSSETVWEMFCSHQMLNLPHKIRVNTTTSVSETLDPDTDCWAYSYSVASHVPLPSFKLIDPIENSVQWTDDQRRSKFQVFWQQYRVEEGHHLQMNALMTENKEQLTRGSQNECCFLYQWTDV